jgi:hypothetical protein
MKFLSWVYVLTLLVGFMDSVFLATRFCSSSPGGLFSWGDFKERNYAVVLLGLVL